ncbi:hypothetical protein CHUAL_000547 [Chamberlinius hualienensis]
MKLYCLSNNPTKPAFALKFKNTTIMLDCGLDMTTVLNFLPIPLVPNSRLSNLPMYMPRDASDSYLEGELRECSGHVFVDSPPEFCPPQGSLISFSDVDIIIISNYLCMLALPYITENTEFRGRIYATEPTLQIGRQFMEEIAYFIERTRKNRHASQWKNPNILEFLPAPLCDAFKPQTWKRWYSTKDIQQSLSKVQTVGFQEKVDVFGMVTVSPVSSGYCLGSCNWIIRSSYESVAYISGSSSLTTHPKPMDITQLKNADALIFCGLTQAPLHNPDAMLGEFCLSVANTVRSGGNVLIPCYSSGVIYDLFECLSSHLDQLGSSLVPMYFISPMADSSLAYSNIYAEWLSQGKQSKVYLPEEPFPHAHLLRSGRLKAFSSLHAEGFSTEFRCPSIVFTGHPSLRFGDVIHFLELWGGSHTNTIVFTEPDFPYIEALAPFQPLSIKVVYCPIDTNLNFSQANKLIRDLKPVHLLVPEEYTQPPPLFPHRTDLTIELETTSLTFKRGDVITLPIKRKYEKIKLNAELADSLVPNEIKPGYGAMVVNGVLEVQDNKCTLMPVNTKVNESSVRHRKRHKGDPKHPGNYTWGKLNIDEFIQKLAQNKIFDAKVEEVSTGYIIHLQNEDTIIQIEDNSTHIVCNGDEQLRKTLRNVLLQCLGKF